MSSVNSQTVMQPFSESNISSSLQNSAESIYEKAILISSRADISKLCVVMGAKVTKTEPPMMRFMLVLQQTEFRKPCFNSLAQRASS